jgi:hypothetical protein
MNTTTSCDLISFSIVVLASVMVSILVEGLI